MVEFYRKIQNKYQNYKCYYKLFLEYYEKNAEFLTKIDNYVQNSWTLEYVNIFFCNFFQQDINLINNI